MELLRITSTGLLSSCHAILFVPAVESEKKHLVSRVLVAVAGSCRLFHNLTIHNLDDVFGCLFGGQHKMWLEVRLLERMQMR